MAGCTPLQHAASGGHAAVVLINSWLLLAVFLSSIAQLDMVGCIFAVLNCSAAAAAAAPAAAAAAAAGRGRDRVRARPQRRTRLDVQTNTTAVSAEPTASVAHC
jgi:hypothetical protein